jgi:lipopolysaccharide export LptBFGC system permease protein LptF
MVRILDRLVFWTFLRLFVLVVAAAQPLFIIGDVGENLDDYIDRGLTGAEVVQSYIYMVPLFIQWTFPLGALLGTVFTVHRMTAHREVVAAKAGGISFHRLFFPLLVAGVGLTGCRSSCPAPTGSPRRSNAPRRRVAPGAPTSCTAPKRA